jgi:hypothetical protein
VMAYGSPRLPSWIQQMFCSSFKKSIPMECRHW